MRCCFCTSKFCKLNYHYLTALSQLNVRSEFLLFLTRTEVKAILANLSGECYLLASLLYGSGLRLTECLNLRVKDIDFEYQQITVRDGKGNKDRVTVLPASMIELLKLQLEKAKFSHQQDLAQGYGAVYLPYALFAKVSKC